MTNFNLPTSNRDFPGPESLHALFAIMNFWFLIPRSAFRDPHSNS